ncbi:4Fe-4S dicluster domain-containing protein [Hyperthermus butylicus]|uniref:Fe-S cluster-containing hydrogenase component 1 n=1 Tax=Hyperthermus butylicus (strain DSM 5456 / JCM 9403 / PLM1-5) TaxID=415426 RepID=A2BJT2_HYPBU|nr:4Fe-4S dicluster domain-containing protein [Hyperthermus butylicus]ABM80243.1 Fe-S cluster-containing hydrogenase component 1 [Hyperthermus butylicus DSM 5456]
MARLAMVIDLNRCTGCMACSIACIRENIARQFSENVELPEGNAIFYARTKPAMIRGGPFGDVPYFIQCMHCENPPCAAVCPTGATYKTKEGVVMLDHSKCIGCRACVIACPYAARTVYRGKMRGPAPHSEALAPGYPDKCTFCYHRAKEGDGKWVPACVEACAFQARFFGDLDDPNSIVHKLVSEGYAVALAPELGTKPKLFFVPPAKTHVMRRR